MSLLHFISPRSQGSGEPTVTPPEEVSVKKNVRVAAFSTDGGYWANGGSFPHRFPVANQQMLYLRRAEDHMDGGVTYRIPLDLTLEDPHGTPVQIHTPTLQTDDVVCSITDADEIIVTTPETDHGDTSWNTDIRHIRLNGTTQAQIGSVELLTDLITGYSAKQYEWEYSRMTEPETGNIYSGFVQLDIDTGTPGSGRFSVLKSTDGGASYTQHEVFTIAPTDTPQSEFLVVPLGSGTIACMLRLDLGGPWRLWVSDDDCATFSFVGSTGLGWQATQVKVVRCYGKNSRGLFDFWVMDRDTGWMCVSRDNAAGDIMAGLFNELELYYYNWTGDSHRGLGYNAGFVFRQEATGIDGVDYTGWSREAASNAYAEWMFTLDDNIDTVAPPEVEAVNHTFVTSNSFLVTVDLSLFTDAERQNIRRFEFGFYSDSGRTTPIMGEYYWTQVSPVSMADFTAASHFINGENIQSMSGQTVYMRVRTINQLGQSAWFNHSFTMA